MKCCDYISDLNLSHLGVEPEEVFCCPPDPTGKAGVNE